MIKYQIVICSHYHTKETTIPIPLYNDKSYLNILSDKYEQLQRLYDIDNTLRIDTIYLNHFCY